MAAKLVAKSSELDEYATAIEMVKINVLPVAMNLGTENRSIQSGKIADMLALLEGETVVS